MMAKLFDVESQTYLNLFFSLKEGTLDNNSDLKSRVNELKAEPETNSNGKGKLKRRMAFLALAISLLFVFAGCKPTDAQIQEAISKTQTAMTALIPIQRRAGCTNKFALNYDQWATANDGTCQYPENSAPIVPGCTDPKATNYDPAATWMATSTCQYLPAPANQVPGCTDPNAVNLSLAATWNDGSCVYKMIPVSGCTDEYATNHALAATVDDHSCVYSPLLGCTDPNAANFNSAAKQDDGSCAYTKTPIPGCIDSKAANFDSAATQDDGSCVYTKTQITGCIDSKATNFDSAATQDDGSCKYEQANLPEGFPSGVPNGNYIMTCNGVKAQSFSNTDIVQFSQQLKHTAKGMMDQATAACSAGSGCSCSNNVGFTQWDGKSFTMNITITVSCCAGGQCMTVPTTVTCIVTGK
ncbi:MAG: hypothetical protein C0410_16000 [Anaerolinea sp.]|nr:hypothetical protein [Anaerolinea sp.]